MKKYPLLREIDRTQHIAMVREIFSTITGKYDFLNRLLSARRDVAWRRFTVRKMRFFRTNRFLDVATGTADLAIEASLRHPGVEIVGLDFTEEMLALGRKKVRERDLGGRIRFTGGDALRLPFPPGAFDVVGIAFGIRNIPDRVRALREMGRVLVPGGRVMILEMNFPQAPLFRPLYRVYLSVLLPLLARAVSPNPKAYWYLADSVMNFPSPEIFTSLMREAGFRGVECYRLTLGVTCLYVGQKPD